MNKLKEVFTKLKERINQANSQKINRASKINPKNITTSRIKSANNATYKYPQSPTSTTKMLTAGSILRARRKELGFSIKRIANDTKIQEAYLEKLEANNFEDFDSMVFVNGYVKIYADYLGLDVDKLSALFRRQTKQEDNTVKMRSNNINKPQGKLFEFLTPNNVLIAMAVIFVLGVVAFISFQFYNFRKAPQLTIYTPADQTVSVEKKLEISGITEDSVSVFINDNEINVEDDNTFTTQINLRDGSNTITVKAVKTNSQQSTTTKILTINYTPLDNEEQVNETAAEPEPEQIDTFTAKVQTLSSEAWIMLTIDGKQKLAQVVPANTTNEFPLTEKLTISTGRPSITKLFINDEEITINVNSETGVANTTCEIKNNSYICN